MNGRYVVFFFANGRTSRADVESACALLRVDGRISRVSRAVEESACALLRVDVASPPKLSL